LKRRMNGLQFRNSTLFFITKSKNRLSSEIVKERDLLKRSLTNNFRRRILVSELKLRSAACTKIFKSSMSSF
jgi:hypothetical protein